MKNKLDIEANGFSVSLEGDGDYVEQAYEAIRSLLRTRYVKTFHTARPTSPTLTALDSERTHITAVVCNEVYLKVYLAEVEMLERSAFARTIDLQGINRIYINRSQQDAFENTFEFGKVLWRELTEKGRSAIKGPSE